MRSVRIGRVFLCLVLVLCLRAQQKPDTPATIRKQVDLVLVDAIVTDSTGSIVNGLQADDFEILDEGVSREIGHFSQDALPSAIALVVDVSGSMAPAEVPLREGLARALPSLKSSDRVALFSFSDRPRMEYPLTRDFKGVAGLVRGLSTSGMTNINDAVWEAAHYLRKAAPAERRIIVVVSDMGATTAGTKPGQEEVLKSETMVFGIRVPSAEDAVADRIFAELRSKGLLNDKIEQQLRREMLGSVLALATATGGVVVEVHRFEGLQPAVERIFQLVRARYTLGFYPDSSAPPGSTRQLEVKLKTKNSGVASFGSFLTYRTQYRVPSDENSKKNGAKSRKK